MVNASERCNDIADGHGHQYADRVHANRHDRRWLRALCIMPIDSDTGDPWPAVLPAHELDWNDDDDRYYLCNANLLPRDVALVEGVPVGMCETCRAWPR